MIGCGGPYSDPCAERLRRSSSAIAARSSGSLIRVSTRVTKRIGAGPGPCSIQRVASRAQHIEVLLEAHPLAREEFAVVAPCHLYVAMEGPLGLMDFAGEGARPIQEDRLRSVGRG